MLRFKPRMRSGSKVTNWIPRNESRNRGSVDTPTYYPPVGGSGIWTPYELVSPFIRGESVHSIEYGNGVWMASADAGSTNETLRRSVDNGITWTAVPSGYTGSAYVALGTNGTGTWLSGGWGIFARSTDNGLTWTAITRPMWTTGRIKFLNGLFFAVGANWTGSAWTGRISTSPDGLTWTTRFDTAPTADLLPFKDIAYGDGKYIAIGGNQAVQGFIYTSTNLTSWANTTDPSVMPGLQSIVYGPSGWVLGANLAFDPPSGYSRSIKKSTNGVQWDYVQVPISGGQHFASKYASGLYVISAGIGFLVSENLQDWEYQPSNTANNIASLGNNGDRWIAGQILFDESQPNIITRSDQAGSIVSSGLVLHLDSANVNSYPRYGTSWYDLSGNNNNGSFVRSVTYTNTNGGELNFASKSYSSHPNSASLQFGSVFTVQAWIRPTNLSARHSIFSTRLNASSGGFSLECGTNEAGNNRIGVSGVGTWVYRSNNNVIPLNQWTNVAYVRNGSSQTMYVNGLPITPASTAAYNITNNTANKTVGIGNIETTEFFGAIPKVYVYNRPLTADEVNQNYHATKAQYV